MSRRTTGTILLLVAAFLFATRYVVAAIYGSGMPGWSGENFRALLQYIGPDLIIGSVVTLSLGVVYLLWAEIEEFLQARK